MIEEYKIPLCGIDQKNLKAIGKLLKDHEEIFKDFILRSYSFDKVTGESIVFSMSIDKVDLDTFAFEALVSHKGEDIELTIGFNNIPYEFINNEIVFELDNQSACVQ